MFGKIVSNSVKLCVSNFDMLTKAGAAWFIVLFVVGTLVAAAEVSGGPGIEGEIAAANLASVLGVSLFLVLSYIAAASISVTWHRYSLLGEVPGSINLRLGKREFAYFVRSVLLICIMFLAVLPAAAVILLLTETFQPLLAIVLILSVPILLMPLFQRLSLALPATALDKSISFKNAFRLGDGFGWPMTGAAFLMLVPFIALSVTLDSIVAAIDFGFPAIFVKMQTTALQVLIELIFFILMISIQSVSFGFAVEQKNRLDGPIGSD